MLTYGLLCFQRRGRGAAAGGGRRRRWRRRRRRRLWSRFGGGGGAAGGVVWGGGGGGRRAPSLRLANGRVAAAQSEEEIRSPPPLHCSRLAKDDSIKISIENTNTCTDSLVTALDDETLLIADYLSNDMNYKGSGKVRRQTFTKVANLQHARI
nr:unnamed protein product [Callosobruchus analis]